MPSNDDPADMDLLADFVLKTLNTGSIGLSEAMKLGAPLKRQKGKLPQAMRHILGRYCRENDNAQAMVELAAAQSPALAKLADQLGLRVKDVTP